MRKRFTFVVLFIQTFISRHAKFIGLGILLGFFSALLTFQIYPIYSQTLGQKNLEIGVVGRYLDTTLPPSILKQISFGLTSVTDSGEATPAGAVSWDISADGLSYTFHLRPDLKWHDGSRFTARDISYKLRNAVFLPLNDNTLKVTLKEPYTPLPVLLSQPILKDNLIGLGIYKVSRIFYKNDYISDLELTPQEKGLPEKIYKFYPNSNDCILGFKLGEINTIEEIADPEGLKDFKNAKIKDFTQFDRYVGVYFNLKNPDFKDKEVRQALTYAIPDFPNFEKAYTPISPLSWAYSQKIRLYRYDTELSQKMLSQSSIASASSELVISTFSSLLSTAQKIADSWKSVGVNTKVKVISSIPPDYEVLLIEQLIPPDPDQYQYWQSTQDLTNLTHYSNLKIDKLLEDGRKTLDVEKRKKIYSDFQKYLVDDAPVIFLYYPKVYTVTRK